MKLFIVLSLAVAAMAGPPGGYGYGYGKTEYAEVRVAPPEVRPPPPEIEKTEIRISQPAVPKMSAGYGYQAPPEVRQPLYEAPVIRKPVYEAPPVRQQVYQPPAPTTTSTPIRLSIKYEAPKAPVYEAPKAAPYYEAPKAAPVYEAPKAAPVYEAPKAAPVYEAPKAAPVYEAPKAAPVYEAPKAAYGSYETERARVGEAPKVIPIVKHVREDESHGRYRLEVETGHGIQHQEQGQLKDLKSEEGPVQVRSGSYSYTGPDGKKYTVNWKADEQGFHATGEHLPTPPPIPEEIKKSLALPRVPEHLQAGPSGEEEVEILKPVPGAPAAPAAPIAPGAPSAGGVSYGAYGGYTEEKVIIRQPLATLPPPVRRGY